MNLSVDTSPAEPTLAALTLGPAVTKDAMARGELDGGAAPFEELFPDLGSRSTGQQGWSMEPQYLTVHGEIPPAWVGSLMPRPEATQDSGAPMGSEQRHGRATRGSVASDQMVQDESAAENAPILLDDHASKTVSNPDVHLSRRTEKTESSLPLRPSVASVIAVSDLPIPQNLPNTVTVAETASVLLGEVEEEPGFSTKSGLVRNSEESVGMQRQRATVARSVSPAVSGAPDAIASSSERRVPANQASEVKSPSRETSPRLSLGSQRESGAALARRMNARSESSMAAAAVDSTAVSAPPIDDGMRQPPSSGGLVSPRVDSEPVTPLRQEPELFARAGFSSAGVTKFDGSATPAQVLVSSTTNRTYETQMSQENAASSPQSLDDRLSAKPTIQFFGEASRDEARCEYTPLISNPRGGQILSAQAAVAPVADDSIDPGNLASGEALTWEFAARPRQSVLATNREGRTLISAQAAAAPTADDSIDQGNLVSGESLPRELAARSKQTVLAEGFPQVALHRVSFSSPRDSDPRVYSNDFVDSPSSDSLKAPRQSQIGSIGVDGAIQSAGAALGARMIPAPAASFSLPTADRLAGSVGRETSGGTETSLTFVPPLGLELNSYQLVSAENAPVGAAVLAPVVAPKETVVTSMRNGTPLVRSEKVPASRGAKIAATNEVLRNSDDDDTVRLVKKVLDTGEQRLVAGDIYVGTGVAKSNTDMPAVAHPTHLIDSDSSDRVAVWTEALSPALESTGAIEHSATSSEPIDSAQRAVEAVLTAADRVTSGGRQSVNLHFTVGGADLNVRVELRANQVHATFRTDSPELRSALASEWQSVNAAVSGESSLRLAAPVFTTTANQPSSNNFSSFAGGDGSSRQRDSRANHPSENAFEVGNSAARRARFVRPESSGESSFPAASAVQRPISPTLARRLQAHA